MRLEKSVEWKGGLKHVSPNVATVEEIMEGAIGRGDATAFGGVID